MQQLAEYNNFSSKDYLTWDEKSMRNLLIRCLSKSGVYTDQIYPGSDLAVLIDIVAYSFAMMTYIANHNSSEATFADAQFYENVNRLCKMLGYKPKGFQTSSTECKIVINNEKYSTKFGVTTSSAVRNLPRYVSYTVGNKTYSLASGESGSTYSDYQSFAFTVDSIGGKPVVSVESNPVFLNGIWKLYGTQFISTGAVKESFVMEDVSGQIAYPFVDVYVYDPKTEIYERYIPVSDLYTSTPNDKVYSIRINEYKQCEIEFGDGINGVRLEEGQILYIIYLESQGDQGKIDADEIDGSSRLELVVQGMNADELMTVCFGGSQMFLNSFDLFSVAGSMIYTEIVSIRNITPSIDPVDFEGVESIRTNAPISYKSGNRLITADDYKHFILSNYSNQVRDCRIMNNFSYCAEFQQYILDHWVDENGNKLPGNPMIRIRQYNYRYSDACDHNNVYLWLRSTSRGNTSEFIKRAILNDTLKIKCIGAEPIPCDALAVVFSLYSSGNYSVNDWDPYNNNKLIVIKDPASLVNNDRVKELVIEKIKSFFSPSNQEIGGTVDISKLHSEILAIEGVKKVYTANVNNDVEITKSEGLSFVYWTPLIIRGSDKNVVVNSPVKMANFQYAELKNPEILNQIVRVKSNNAYIASPEF